MECENLRILYVPFRVYSMYEFIGDVGSERMENLETGNCTATFNQREMERYPASNLFWLCLKTWVTLDVTLQFVAMFVKR